MNIYSRTFGPVRAGQAKMKAISKTENNDGGPGRGEIPAAAQDLAPAPVDKAPLTGQEDSAPSPHRYIVAAAIRQGALLICSMPRPARHNHVMRQMAAAGVPIPITGEQGFLTSDGRFVDRTRALLIAKQAGQVINPSNRYNLFSEDLW